MTLRQNLLSSYHKQILLSSVIIFVLTFCLLGFAVDTFWFREDDLGTILNGIIRSWDDFVRVFSADCRSFITPANYQRTSPNVISGFLRPMQNVIFSIVYYLWGVAPHAYLLTHVAFHAANTALFFILCSLFLPLSYSWLAGLMFAFYPNISWLTWIGTVQNSLATFFLLLSLLFFYRVSKCNRDLLFVCHPELVSGSTPLLAGFLFLLSLLSRESGILLPLWFFAGVLILQGAHRVRSSGRAGGEKALVVRSPQGVSNHASEFKKSILAAFEQTWVFFLAPVIFFLMRLWAFGLQTLPRTFGNLFLRLPWLSQLWVEQKSVIIPVCQVSRTIADGAAVPAAPVQQSTFLTLCLQKIQAWSDKLYSWVDSFIPLQINKFVVLGLFVFTLIFLLFAYRNQKKLFAWLAFGAACTAWPGFLAYPCPRYLNLMYPFIIFMLIYGIFLAKKIKFLALLMLALVTFLTINGLLQNRQQLKAAAHERFVYKQRFDNFFEKNRFAKNAQFFIVSSPYVSDIQSIFQAYLGNFSTIVIFDPFCTLAEKGFMGCREDYRVVGVKTEITLNHDMFRLTSHDKKTGRPARQALISVGWWLRHSDFPVAWVASSRSYQWTQEPYRENIWYPCSIGKFMIHEMLGQDLVTDISFVIDQCWVNELTVFVAWDTMLGEYVVLNSPTTFS